MAEITFQVAVVTFVVAEIYALEWSGGMLHRKILKTKASNGAFETTFRRKYGSFLCLER